MCSFVDFFVVFEHHSTKFYNLQAKKILIVSLLFKLNIKS